MLRSFFALAIISICCSEIFSQTFGVFSPQEGSARETFYLENQNTVQSLLETVMATDTNYVGRLTAFETLSNLYPEAALYSATLLIDDESDRIATESTWLLADEITMTNHPFVGRVDPNSHATVVQRNEAARSALRSALMDERYAVRDVAASSLAGLGDVLALESIRSGVDKGIYLPVEAVNYFALAQSEVGSVYIEPFLHADSNDAKLAAVTYLGPQTAYSNYVRDEIFFNVDEDPQVRAKAAEVLSRFDDNYSSYVLPVILEPNSSPDVASAVLEGYYNSVTRQKSLSAATAQLLLSGVDRMLIDNPDNARLQVLHQRLLQSSGAGE